MRVMISKTPALFSCCLSLDTALREQLICGAISPIIDQQDLANGHMRNRW
jgi:hypothetical protein